MFSFKVLKFLKSNFSKIVTIGLGLLVMGCSGGGSCTGCNNGSITQSPTFSITAPAEYPAGIATTVYLTIYNTSSVNAENIRFKVESKTTNAQIGIYPDGAGNSCNNIAAYESCVFTATIESGSNPGSFTISATGTSSVSTSNSTNITSANFNASVAVSIGLVSIPGNSYHLYLLPPNQTVNLSSNGNDVLFSVLVESNTIGPISLMSADGTPIIPAPILISPIPDGSVYESGMVATFRVNYPANLPVSVESLVAFSSTCTSNNCSNPAFVNFVESGVGILTLAPSNVTLSESYTSQIYTLTNTGESAISIASLPTITFPLSIVNNCGATPFILAPVPSANSSCTFTLTYAPVSIYGLEVLSINYNNGSGFESTALSITYAPNPPLITWMSGSNALNQPAVYGSKGVPNPGNIPGARYASAGWANNSGNLWLFGGYGGGGFLNDFWQYNINSDQWTWLGGSESINTPGVYGTMGVESTTNMPGSRYLSASWVDQAGNFWLFGGYGYNYQNYRNVLNDLWKYDINTHQWVWMSGTMNLNSPGVYGEKGVESAGNVPGGRLSAVSWADSQGNLWLFGGSIPGSSIEYNDLWKYSINSGKWTWMSGSSSANEKGSYGTIGIESSDNVPGARDSSNTWIDAAGNLWLFGGNGYSSTSFFADSLNDLWKYDVNSGNWVWMSGSKDLNQLGVYGILQVPSSSNVPGARYKAASWQDNYGNFWIFGGDASQSNASVSLNDLWQYNPKTGIWTWIAGANLINQGGSYGAIGVGSIGNIPGARYSEVSWQESGNLWLFSGLGFPALNNESGYLNDLWKINLSN